jgi:SHS2 domain-containing protein
MQTDESDKPSPPVNPSWLEALDHTADAGIVVHADDLQQLFARAAWGMFSVITDVNVVKAAEKIHLAIKASDRHALLVKWLSELNYRHVKEHQLFCRFDILVLTDQTLEAEVQGEPTDRERHTIYTEIKAVTFHGLQIENAGHQWTATIIFDL